MRRSSGVDKRPHHGAVPLQAQPRPSTCTRPDRSNPLRRSYAFLTSPGHLGVPKHSPPSTTRKAGAKRTCTRNESTTMATTLHHKHPVTFSYIKHDGLVQFSPVFEPNRRHNEPQRQKCGPFRVKGRRKNTRTIVHGQYRHETGNSTNKTNRKDTWTNLVPFFLRVGPLKATFELPNRTRHACSRNVTVACSIQP